MLKSTLLKDIPHGFFTRQGGVSEGRFASLNFASERGDPSDHIAKNRQIALETLDCPDSPLIMVHQVHGNQALPVTAPWPKDENGATCLPKADALVTATPGLVLGVITADCVPVLLYDPQASIIGAAHAGWRGAVSGILSATVAAMETLGARASHILGAVGPCIHQLSYEVGKEVYNECLTSCRDAALFFQPSLTENHYYFDLPGFAAYCLVQAGVNSIESLPYNTYENDEIFFSYRRSTHRNDLPTGNQLSAIGLPRTHGSLPLLPEDAM